MLVRVRVCANGSLHVLVINRCCSLLACFLLLLLASWIVVILLACLALLAGRAWHPSHFELNSSGTAARVDCGLDPRRFPPPPSDSHRGQQQQHVVVVAADEGEIEEPRALPSLAQQNASGSRAAGM